MNKTTKITIAVIFLGFYLISMIGVTSALIINSVSMNPNEIAPGETAKINIEIENDWNEDVNDVSVVLDLKDVPFAPYDSSSEDSFDEIRDGKSKIAEFKIIALNDAKSGIYKIPLEINFYDENNNKSTKKSLISLVVNSKPVIGVDVKDGLLLKGKENNLEIKIINKGLSDVKFLEIETEEGNYYTLLSGKNIYIGDIDSDDFDSADFKIYFKENTPDTITLPVSITYKDSVNKKYTENFNLQVDVYTKKKAIELVIILWFIYRKIKKRRKLKRTKLQEESNEEY